MATDKFDDVLDDKPSLVEACDYILESLESCHRLLRSGSNQPIDTVMLSTGSLSYDYSFSLGLEDLEDEEDIDYDFSPMVQKDNQLLDETVAKGFLDIDVAIVVRPQEGFSLDSLQSYVTALMGLFDLVLLRAGLCPIVETAVGNVISNEENDEEDEEEAAADIRVFKLVQKAGEENFNDYSDYNIQLGISDDDLESKILSEFFVGSKKVLGIQRDIEEIKRDVLDNKAERHMILTLGTQRLDVALVPLYEGTLDEYPCIIPFNIRVFTDNSNPTQNPSAKEG